MGIEKNLQKSVPLASFTTFGIGGPADYFVKAQTTDDLINAVTWARSRGIPLFVLGSGANILVADKGFRGLVIKNESSEFHFEKNNLVAESGVTIEKLINETSDRGLSGLEHFAGIPSTLGGAMWQNLHFLSPDRNSTVYIGSLVKKARILTPDSHVLTVPAKYFQFAYDWSSLHESGDIVLDALLQLTTELPETIMSTITANLTWRSQKHPKNAWKNSAGSVFKKIEGHGAGRLIDAAGLKGRQIGGAQISALHANFIQNVGGATARDVRELISLVQESVKRQTGLVLNTEISFVGEF